MLKRAGMDKILLVPKPLKKASSLSSARPVRTPITISPKDAKMPPSRSGQYILLYKYMILTHALDGSIHFLSQLMRTSV